MSNSKEVDVKSLVRKSGINFPSGIIKLKIKPIRKQRKKTISKRKKPARKRLSMRNKKTLEVKSMEVLGKKIEIKNNEVVLGGGKRRKRKRKGRRKTKKKRKMRKRKTKRRR